MITADQPPMMLQLHQLMPAISTLGVLVAAGVVPLALLCYALINSAWTFGQLAVAWRWSPTPGSASRNADPQRAELPDFVQIRVDDSLPSRLSCEMLILG